MSETRKLAAILVADIVGYSRLAGADEERVLARLRALRSDLIDPTVAIHRGRIVKRTGDGAIIEFRSAVDAVRCAIEVQNGMAERNAGLPDERRLEFRVGIHIGDVVEEADGDLMGDGVNIAARLEGVAKPGAICLSEDAYRQVRARIDLAVSDLGSRELKNIAEPIRVYLLEVGAAARPRPSARADPEKPSAAPSTPDRASIAVLPFQNMSGDPEQEYFADGITEDIITALSKIPGLFVIARNSSFTFKGKAVDIAEASKKLHVRFVLEGSVRKAGGRVRITAQLIDGLTSGHVWAERFDRELTDIFAVQDEVTQEIVSALALNLAEGKQRRFAAQPTHNAEAYDLFLRARELWYRQKKELNAQALEMLARAVELDPNFASAYGFAAVAHMRDYLNRWTESPSLSMDRGYDSAMRAVALDEKDPYAHWALGSIYLWKRRHEDAERELEKAISIDPNFAFGHLLLGMARHYAGRSEQALEPIGRAIALDPYADFYLHYQAQAYFQLAQYEKAAEILKRRITRNPDTDISRVLLAACLGHLGRPEEALAQWREVFRVNPNYSLEHRRQVLPYKNPEDFERVVEGLRKAGLPEQ
jgi:adenylate cyclase